MTYVTKKEWWCVTGSWNNGAPLKDGALQECSTEIDCRTKCDQDKRCAAFAHYPKIDKGYTARKTIKCQWNPVWNTYIKNTCIKRALNSIFVWSIFMR